MCFPAKFKKFLRKPFFSVGSGFQSGVAMEHWKALSTTMVGWQKKCLNSRRSRPKALTFWLGDSLFCFETVSFFSLFSFFLFAMQKSGGRACNPRPLPAIAGPVFAEHFLTTASGVNVVLNTADECL